MTISEILFYENLYDKEKYPVEPYEELVVLQKPNERKFEILGAWKTGCLTESSNNTIYISGTLRSYSVTYRWDYNTPVARKSWEYISNRESVIKGFMPEIFPENEPEILTRLCKLKGIGFVYAVFVMHSLNPILFPLFDQHVMRAFYSIEKDNKNIIIRENNNGWWDWQDYVYYKNFFDSLLKKTGVEYWRLDRALWSYGKHLKQKRVFESKNLDGPPENYCKKSHVTDSGDNRFWIRSYTLGDKEKEFFWRIDADIFTIKRNFKSGTNISKFTFDELETIQENMPQNTWISLSNNVEKLSNGTEKWGVGRIITEKLSRSPSDGQLASHLSALFVEGNIWKHNGQKKGMMFMKENDISWKYLLEKLHECRRNKIE